MPGECYPPTAADYAMSAAHDARDEARKNGTTLAKLEARVSALEETSERQQRRIYELERVLRLGQPLGQP